MSKFEVTTTVEAVIIEVEKSSGKVTKIFNNLDFEDVVIEDAALIKDFLHDIKLTKEDYVEDNKHKETDTHIQYWFDA